MDREPSLCVICAWRKDCQKKFSKSKDISFRCPDFTKDLSIKDSEYSDDKKGNRGDTSGSS
jgi:hypothetical protein